MSLHHRPDGEDPMEFLVRVLADAAASVTGLTVSLGDQLGLYRAMAAAGPLTSAELAARTGTEERHVREWLHSQVTAGYVRLDRPESGPELYELPAAHAAVLADDDSPYAAIGIFGALQALYRMEDRLLESFRGGAGVGWGDYPPEMFRAIGRFFRPGYQANVVEHWLPGLHDNAKRLTDGGHVADVGCGVGHSTLLMAEAYPAAAFHGLDSHDASIDVARETARARGLGDRVRFSVAGAGDLAGLDSPYDLITFFDCLHDMGDPLTALRSARRSLSDRGSVMLVEPRTSADPEANADPIGRLFLAVSPVLCLPAAMAQEGGHALGNHPGEETLRDLAREAGFPNWRRVAESPVNAVYELRP